MVDAAYFRKNICLLAVQRVFGAREIFSTPLEYNFFLKLIRRCKGSYPVKVFSFCLLPSVIYLVVGGEDCYVIAKFLDEMNARFCGFIREHDKERSGLQINRSRLVILEDDMALMDIAAFVDALPVRRGMVKREEQYEWSSFRLRAFGIDNGIVETLS